MQSTKSNHHGQPKHPLLSCLRWYTLEYHIFEEPYLVILCEAKDISMNYIGLDYSERMEHLSINVEFNFRRDLSKEPSASG